jgi:hypothetical protein
MIRLVTFHDWAGVRSWMEGALFLVTIEGRAVDVWTSFASGRWYSMYDVQADLLLSEAFFFFPTRSMNR